jgi:hypothetical protein
VVPACGRKSPRRDAAGNWAFEVPEPRGAGPRAAVENVASNHVAEKAYEGARAQRYNPRLDKRVDFVMRSLLREEL